VKVSAEAAIRTAKPSEAPVTSYVRASRGLNRNLLLFRSSTIRKKTEIMKPIPSLKLKSSLPGNFAAPQFGRKPRGSSQVSIVVLIASALVFLAGLVFFLKSRASQDAEAASSGSPSSKPFPPREQLDSKLVFKGKTFTPFPPHDWAFEGISPPVMILEARPFPVIDSVWGQKDVFAIHPLSHNEPGVVEFDSITSQAKGTLAITIRDHPKGDCIVEVMKDGALVGSPILLDKDDWQTIEVPFDKNAVSLNIRANGWACEHAFLTYEFKNN
jgi:hypothetical protein